MPRFSLKPILLRAYRAGVLVLIAWLIHHQHAWLMAQRSTPLTVERVRDFFPKAVTLGEIESSGTQRVLDADSRTIGLVAQTSPLSDKIIGYAGPTNTLIALDAQAKVIGLRVLRSEDTPEHLAEVIKKRSFFDLFKGIKLGETSSNVKVDAVSGATLTSTAIAEGVLKRLGQQAPSLRFPAEITLEEVREVLPAAVLLKGSPQPSGFFTVEDASGNVIAQAGRTSPVSDAIVGYKGPSDSLLILNPEGTKLVTFRVRKSFDTKEYVGYVTEDQYYINSFNGMEITQLADLDFAKAKVEGVSGATETSWAVAEGLKRRAQKWVQDAAVQKTQFAGLTMNLPDWGLLGVFMMSIAMTFTSLRGKRWARGLHQALLIGYVGFFCGAMISQGLLVGWARHGIPWQSAPLLTLVAAMALAFPLFARRQFYCHHYCPHGALQQLMANRFKWHLRIPPRFGKWLDKIPWLLLTVVLVVAMTGLHFSLNALEPFDAWLIRVAGWGTISVAVVGLGASLFIPMAYCRYGCPTGALLKFVRYAGQGDFFNKRDFAALAFVGLAVILHVTRGHFPH